MKALHSRFQLVNRTGHSLLKVRKVNICLQTENQFHFGQRIQVVPDLQKHYGFEYRKPMFVQWKPKGEQHRQFEENRR
jgi:hypothetical protein